MCKSCETEVDTINQLTDAAMRTFNSVLIARRINDDEIDTVLDWCFKVNNRAWEKASELIEQ